MPQSSSSIFFDLKETILLYDLSGIGGILGRDMMAIQATNH
jgi:hypothetical protein